MIIHKIKTGKSEDLQNQPAASTTEKSPQKTDEKKKKKWLSNN